MKRFSKKNSASGFTLIEILLYISLSVVIVGAVSASILMFFEIRTRNEVIREVEEQGEFAMRTLKQSIQSANGINSASGSTLSLETLNNATDPTIFTLSGGAIEMTEGTDPAVALTNSDVVVSGLTFTDLTRPATNGMVRIQFTVTYDSTSSRFEYDYAQDFYATESIR